MGYNLRHVDVATCPECKQPATVEEFDAGGQDYVEACCNSCNHSEKVVMEAAEPMLQSWEAQLPVIN